ncbi:PHB depolymerase family esterase [Aquabacterium sp. J223]|uniref:extracellular catalytic domain type 1 short-chain-length polyhydroxyalkanoate depolymerase n=1 Tax=Aquabacterium sp. J223 TaxID=2898431 RepID=UPI0021AE0CBB|nr:PHB depolymerase family esterase [Aquabacterium sp. J223]UUX97161.1 prolyl oligopeptidase family serine peptidase [Aquabacterium sp. J223]
MRRRPALLGLIALLPPLLMLAPATAQDGGLRERLRERREQRREQATHPGPLAAGTHTLQVEHGGERREVILHVPARVDAARPAPLVLAFHGGGGHAAYMADDGRYGWVSKAEREGFVVAFPNGHSRRRSGRFATWNAGGCCGEARDRNVDDVGFSRAVVAAVAARVAVDRGRVFATGMSNGGMLAHRLACDAADLFRAVAAVAGTDGTTECRPSRPVSVLHVHARDDTHVLFDGGAGADAFRDPSQVMAFTSVADTMARWVQRNRCAPTPQRVLSRPGAFCEAYSGCAGGSRVQLCVTEDGGHSWPGAPSVRRGKAPASSALDANEVIWDFFVTSAAVR